MTKNLFKESINVVAEYVIEALKDEIRDQIDLVTVSDCLWSNEEHHCNFDVAVEHLKIIINFLYWVNDDNWEMIDEQLKDGMHIILYDEPYYDFNVIQILENSDIEADANEFNKILISYLRGKYSIDDFDDDNEGND